MTVFPNDQKATPFPAPGTWRTLRASGEPTATVRCPKCGAVGSLAGTHTIAADGKVSPSVICPHCDFHEWITLDGWHT